MGDDFFMNVVSRIDTEDSAGNEYISRHSGFVVKFQTDVGCASGF
jgi:hypothetical protein